MGHFGMFALDLTDIRNPKPIGRLSYADFCRARGRFSSYNIQPWAAPGLAKPNFVAMTCFNAGLPIFDISNPIEPKEVA